MATWCSRPAKPTRFNWRNVRGRTIHSTTARTRPTNELGIYIATGAFDNSELIEVFVSWGAVSLRETRESVANLADSWVYGDRVAIAPGASRREGPASPPCRTGASPR
jgi:hypothetical protein